MLEASSGVIESPFLGMDSGHVVDGTAHGAPGCYG